MNSRSCLWLSLSFLCLGAIGTCSATAGESTGDLRASGQKYLATLTSEQKAKGVLPYDTPQRVGWHFIPKEHRKGLQIKDMNSEQRAAVLLLLREALSQLGYDKTTKIMSLEAILRELEKSRRGGAVRDPERYYLTVFGNPTANGRWGLSVEGHHVSLNFVAEGPRLVASTPRASSSLGMKEYKLGNLHVMGLYCRRDGGGSRSARWRFVSDPTSKAAPKTCETRRDYATSRPVDPAAAARPAGGRRISVRAARDQQRGSDWPIPAARD